MAGYPALDALLPLVVLLFAALAAYILVRRSRPLLPAALLLSGLVLAALATGIPALAPVARFRLPADAAMGLLLPILLFRAGLAMDAGLLSRNLRPALVVGVGGPLLVVPLVGFGLAGVLRMPLPIALLAATLLVAAGLRGVQTLFRELGVPRRVITLADGEELFRQCTAVVLVGILLAAPAMPAGVADAILTGGAAADSVERVMLHGAGVLVVNLAVGFATGLLAGWVFARLIGALDREPVLAVPLTIAAAYISFLVASLLLGVSGVLAAAGAGLAIGASGRGRLEPGTLRVAIEVWALMAAAVEILVLLVAGLAVPAAALVPLLGGIALAVALALAARATTVFGLFHLQERFFGGNPAEVRHQALLVWGAVDGSVALLLAMGLPPGVPFRDLLFALVFGAALLGALLQRPTMGLLARRLGLGRANPSDQYVRDSSLLAAKQRARERLPQLRHGGMVGDRLVARLEAEYAREEGAVRERLDLLREKGLLEREEELTLLKRRFLLLEKQTYLDLFHNGQVSEKVFRELQHAVDVQVDALRSPAGLPAWGVRSLRRGRAEIAFGDLLERVFPDSAALQRRRLQRIAELYETYRARVVASDRVLDAIDTATREEGAADGLLQVRALFQLWNANGRQSLDRIADRFPEYASRSQQILANRFCLRAEEQVLDELEALEVLPQGQARALRDGVDVRRRDIAATPVEPPGHAPAELLRHVTLFGALPDAEVSRIAELLRPRSYGADEAIVEQGGPGGSLFVIARGVVRVLRRGAGGAEEAIATLVAGDFFGETSVLSPAPRPSSVRAVTAATLYELRREDLLVLGIDRLPLEHLAQRG